MKRYIMLGCGWIAVFLGFTGIFIPVLPTTPFLLLAAFLFTKSSPRMSAWLQDTKAYKQYVEPFKSSGGIPLRTKIRALAISYTVLIISAILAPLWFVRLILAAVALFLLWLMMFKIPTIDEEKAKAAALDPEAPPFDSNPKAPEAAPSNLAAASTQAPAQPAAAASAASSAATAAASATESRQRPR